MTIDEFLKKHDMTAYQFAKMTGWQQSQISRFRSGTVAWSKPHDFLLDALDFAIGHGFKGKLTKIKIFLLSQYNQWFSRK